MRNRFSLIRIVAVVLLLYSLWSLYGSYAGIQTARRIAAERESSLARLKTENAQLLRESELAEDESTLEKLARERLGYILPGERVFLFSEPENGKNQ